MALEQMNAFFGEKRQDTLGPTTVIGPDSYPMLESSDLKHEHEMVSQVVAGMGKSQDRGYLNTIGAVNKMLESEQEQEFIHISPLYSLHAED